MPILPASILLLLAGAQAGQDIPARLLDPGPIKSTEVSSLVGYLESPDPKVRVAALEFWGKRHWDIKKVFFETYKVQPEKVIESIVGKFLEALTDPNPKLRGTSLRSICLFYGTPSLIPGCGNGSEFSFSHYVPDKITEKYPGIQKTLDSLVSDSNPEVVFGAFCLMTEQEIKNHSSLMLKYFDSKNEMLQIIAAMFCIFDDDEYAYRFLNVRRNRKIPFWENGISDAFFRNLKNAKNDFGIRDAWEPWARKNLLEKLAERPDELSKRMLLEFIEDTDVEIRVRAIRSLGYYDKSQSVLRNIKLMRLFADAKAEVREAALSVLISREVPQLREIIERALNDQGESVVLSAMSYCSKSEDLYWTEFLEKTATAHPELYMFSSLFSRLENANRVPIWLSSKNVGVRRAVVYDISENFDASRHGKIFRQALADSDVKVFNIVATTLVIKDHLTFQELMKWLDKSNQEKYIACMYRLADHPDKRDHIEFFESQLDSDNVQVVKICLEYLIESKRRSVDSYIEECSRLKGEKLAIYLRALVLALPRDEGGFVKKYLSDESNSVRTAAKLALQYVEKEEWDGKLFDKLLGRQ